MTEETAPAGRRRPQPEDLDAILFSISEGKSLRATCAEMGLDTPSTHTWLDEDPGRRQQYARAREMRAEFYQEEGLVVTKAAALGLTVNGKKVDASGAKAYLDAIKWSTARMSPKTAPIQRHEHRFGDLTDEELDRYIAERTATDDAGDADT